MDAAGCGAIQGQAEDGLAALLNGGGTEIFRIDEVEGLERDSHETRNKGNVFAKWPSVLGKSQMPTENFRTHSLVAIAKISITNVLNERTLLPTASSQGYRDVRISSEPASNDQPSNYHLPEALRLNQLIF